MILGILTGAIAATTLAVTEAQQAPAASLRQGQSSTSLADGRVLIAGGDAEGTAEIRDAAGTTPIVARMVVARSRHGAVRLASGNVLIVGGYAAGTASIEEGAEIFDVVTERFTKIRGTRTPRVQPTLTRRDDGVVEIAGGDAAGTTEFYDPVTNMFGGDPAAPSIVTDRNDYAPGETVTFTGTRWAPGELVTITLREVPAVHDELALSAFADDNGTIVNTDFAPEPHDIGVRFEVTATGASSTSPAHTTFTDAAPPSSSYNVTSFGASLLVTGTDIGNHCDDCTTPVTTPFPITFYDSVFNVITLSSNGNIQFGGAAFENPNRCLPTTIFAGAVMPYWDDLRTDVPAGTGKGIFVQTLGVAPTRQYYIRWNTSYFSTASGGGVGSATFAVVFYENQTRIDFVYGPQTGNSATIGVQRTSTGPATQYACNIFAVGSGTGLTFTGVPIATSTATTLTSSPNPSALGATATITATVKWNGNAVGTGTVSLKDGANVIAWSDIPNAAGQAVFQLANLRAGSHLLVADYSGSNGLQPSSGALTHVVDKGNATTTVVTSPNPSVVGQIVAISATVNPVAPAFGTPSGTVQFKDGGVDIGLPVALSGGRAVLSATFTSPGPRSITASYSGDASFNTAPSANVSHIVNKASTTTTVVSDLNPSRFNDAVTFTASILPLAPGAGAPGGTVQFKDDGADFGAPAALTGGTASVTIRAMTTGPHSITAVYSGDATFNASASNPLSQAVNKAPATITLNAAHLIQTFDGSPRNVGYTTAPAGLSGVSVTYNGLVTAPTDAGSYAVTASLTDMNYEATPATATLVVNKATPSVTVNGGTFTYDAAAHPATGSTTGVIGADLGPVTFTYNGNAAAPVNAGTYAVVGTFAGNDNYEASSGAATIVISKATPTVTVKGGTFTYDGAAHPATGSVTGVMSADLGLLTFSYNGDAAAAVNAGTYAVVGRFAGNDNYEAASGSATIVINRAVLRVTAADATVVYGQPPPTFSVGYDGFVNGETPAVLAGAITLTTINDPRPGAGTYSITPGGLSAANYQITYGAGTLTITRATLTVTVAAETRPYGSANPAFSVRYAGFVAGETAAVLAGTLQFATSATVTSRAGVYEVGASGLTSPNYAISYAAGSLTIVPAPLTVRADSVERLVGAPNPALTASFSGFVLGETPAVLTGTLTFTTPATASSPIGRYPISPSGLSSPNYAIQYVDGTLTVTYGVCALYDQTKVAKSGSTIPIKLQLCDASGSNASSPSVVVTAERLMLISTDVTGLPEDAGNANPDANFRYADSGYRFNLQTTGVGSGKWRLVFNVANDPVEHFVAFSVK